jgi:tetratricopeptide (TPR) repeat protein
MGGYMPGIKLFTPIILLFLVLCIGCTQQDAGKMPITTNSDQAKVNFLKGRELFDKLRLQESLEHFEKAIGDDPEFGMAYFYFSQAQPTAKGFFEQLDNALLCVDKISEAESNLILGLQAAINGNPMLEREYYQKNVDAYPDDERMLTLLATNYYGQQEYQKAVDLYNNAVKINSDFSPGYNQLGYANRVLEKFDDAEIAFKKYTELIPDDPNPYDSYAELLMKVGRYEESIEQYQAALKLNPNFVASHIGIATNLNYLDKQSEAREQCQKLFDIARNDGEKRTALFAMAVSYVDEDDNKNAIKKIEEQYALADRINDAANKAADLNIIGNIYFECANCPAAKGRYDLAIKTIRESNLSEKVKANAEMNYSNNEALIAMEDGDYNTAKLKTEEYWQKAVANNNPTQKRICAGTNARIAMAEKDFDTAIEFLNNANLQNPYNLYRLAICYKMKKDFKNAKLYCEKAANFNALNSMNYAFCRIKAKEMLEKL